MNNSIDTYQFCEEIMSQYEHGLSVEVDNFFQFLKDFFTKYDSLAKKLPYHINVIDELHVNENANSRILAALLQYNEGGDFTVLKSFVDFFMNDQNIEISQPTITSENLRIDLLVREPGKYAIIFENKIYGAVLQKNQIARYIQKMRNEGFKDNQIHVVFLPPTEEYIANECSWKEPSKVCETCDCNNCNNENKSLREDFLNRFTVVTFREGIIEWLKEAVILNCRQKEVYLYTAATQYLDYLEGYFDLRTINKTMNMELQEYLIEKLQLKDLEDDQQLDLLDKKIKEIQRLLNQMDSIKAIVRKRIAVADRKNWESVLYIIREKVTSVSERLELDSMVDFVFPDSDEDSHLYISFFKSDWELSIIFEKYSFDALQSFFIYIGKPAEKNVDSKYNNINRIFKERSESSSHPYGWEYDEKYHQKPKELIQDIKSGSFEMYLERKLKEVLRQIDEYQLPMK